jgi:formylmethanofuran dehydrogenase subunit E
MRRNSSRFPKDFNRCADFHGHVCPGLAIGYRAARAGMDWLREKRAKDEEWFAIVETDACGVDAIQVLTGCTFGKGNLIYRDYGKHVFIMASRSSGKGIRIALKAGALVISEPHRQLLEKMRKDEATDREKQQFAELHLQRTREILSKPLKDIFAIGPIPAAFPPKARIEPSRPCARCGEPTMPSKLQKIAKKEVCRECLD